jgi:hypothetical protein
MVKKQTAVEWLFEQIVNRTDRMYFLKELEQAKEMEKEQIIKAYETGRCRGMSFDEPIYYDRNWSSNERYYNETYKSE